MATTESRSLGSGVSGTCDPKFARVREEFERNFAGRGEVGASACVTVEGETVVDLWGGTANSATGAPWQADTVGIVWSCTKGATATCAHVLAARGQLDLDAPVTQYWPEYGQAGKENIRVWQLLAHQAGLAAIRQPLPAGAFYDWDLMVTTLAAQEPFWEPGTRHGYHAITFGWLVGEVVRRASGKSLGTFFQEAVAGPLGLDFWIGLPEAVEPRVAPMILPDPPSPDEPPNPFFVRAMTDPQSLPALIMGNTGGYMEGGDFDSRAAHAAEIGAAGGITNARGLAGLYAPLACGGRLRGVELVDRDTLARMGRVVSAGQDAVFLLPSRFATGYMKAMDNRRLPPGQQESALLAEEAFGHAGYGGSIGFADPKARMSFGYMMNKMGPGTLLNPRGQSLVDATYLSLGYTSNASGTWL